MFEKKSGLIPIMINDYAWTTTNQREIIISRLTLMYVSRRLNLYLAISYAQYDLSMITGNIPNVYIIRCNETDE